ncbi:hypothetical protein BO78DRAFT_38564 [Aspergillus sclerotiicarbonarius CBS 121057]|uniref:C2H2-type domain-containing protein n=1 Tax=Aspergillus sclerotiicarbonarius (strain CBS 121057 / IBT 28362) TaxID=1448318 RepID=A0A319ER61_ASPSB|nr:hypothetical protein BO78DRAFT_38564 [Aspergillus sclerotiicarbonarius CBS 121057]
MHHPIYTTGLGYPDTASAFAPRQQGPRLGPSGYVSAPLPVTGNNPHHTYTPHENYMHGIAPAPGPFPTCPNRRGSAVETHRQASHDLRCQWKDCTTRPTFNRWEDLSRHIKTIHVFPHSYVCPVIGCGRLFNRKDNLEEHMSRHHQG